MVNDEKVSIVYKGNGVTKVFEYPYTFTEPEEITGYLFDGKSVKQITYNFKFDGATKRYTYPTTGDPMTDGMSLLLTRYTERSNKVALPKGHPFKNIESQFDKVVRMIQELNGGIQPDKLDDKWDAQHRAIKNLPDPTTNDEAVTLGYFKSTQADYLQQSQVKVDEATKQAQVAAEEAAKAKKEAERAKAWVGGDFVIAPDYRDDQAQIYSKFNNIEDELKEKEDALTVIFPLYGDETDPPGENTDGDCIICGAKGKWFMVDTYHQERNFKRIKKVIEAHGIKEFEFIVISHYHWDHFGNLGRILSEYTVKKVIIPPAVEKYSYVDTHRNQVIEYCNTYHVPYEEAINTTENFYGVTIDFRNVSQEDYAYYDANTDDYNDYSLVLTLTYKKQRVLLTGDLCRMGSRHCLDKGYIRGEYDIFKAGHHGNSSTELQLFREVNPKYVVVTQTPGMARLSYIHGVVSYFTHRGIPTYIVGYQPEDLVFSVSAYGVKTVSWTEQAGTKGCGTYLHIYVDKNIPKGTYGNGTPEHPFGNLNDALYYAYENTGTIQITLADGDYSKDLSGIEGMGWLEIDGHKASLVISGNTTDPSRVLIPNLKFKNCNYVYVLGVMTAGYGSDGITVDNSKFVFIHHTRIQGERSSFGLNCSGNTFVMLTDVKIDNKYMAIYCKNGATCNVSGNDNLFTNVSYEYRMDKGGKIRVVGNGSGNNLAYPYTDSDANTTPSELCFNNYQTIPTNLRVPIGTIIAKTNGRAPYTVREYVAVRVPNNTDPSVFKESCFNIIEKSIGEPPLYVGQLAVAGGAAYIATGTGSTADWKKITT